VNGPNGSSVIYAAYQRARTLSREDYLTHVIGAEETDYDKYHMQGQASKRLKLHTDILWPYGGD